ncbi:ABC transporter permease [Nocardioides sp. ChNu-153]|uniref:ABC transporter permease n=1 Tax=Nocardioides sp. ChNu-153 TaxID=2779364 RepID=UPI0026557477|nr:ABC transporter permease [Nocardioides sp. ChNu-153]MDN7123134.1 ABC transporter permease [Nocardioides sp. ChNu-153]
MSAEPVADQQGRLPEEVGHSLKEIAERHGLRQVGGRPRLGAYLKGLLERRHFALVLARSQAYSQNQGSYLGQAWNILNPLINAAVYLTIFGYVLKTDRGVENYIAYLLVGVFFFQFVTRAITLGSKAVVGNTGLVNSLQFPRALLPISTVLTELIAFLPAIVVLLVLMPISGEPLRWWWLALPGAVALMHLWGTGMAFLLARLVVEVRDVANLIPFAMRALMYFSGVFFSITSYAGSGLLGTVLEYQPVAVYLQLARTCLMVEAEPSASLWIAAAAWAFGTLLVGFLFFWRAEAKYGRG